MKLCNLIGRALALFATPELPPKCTAAECFCGERLLIESEADSEVFKPMQPLRWTEDQAREYHPSQWSPETR